MHNSNIISKLGMFFWALLALENAMTVVVVHWIVRLYWRSTAPTGKWALLGNLALDSAAARPAPTGKWALLGNHALDSAAARPAPTGKWALLGNHALDSAAARPAPTGKWALLGNHALDSAAALESGKNKFLSPLEHWAKRTHMTRIYDMRNLHCNMHSSFAIQLLLAASLAMEEPSTKSETVWIH